MITLPVPDIQYQEVALKPEARSVRGQSGARAERLEGRISLGEPVAVALTGERVKEDATLATSLLLDSGVVAFEDGVY
jgi:hypothetical protein